MKAFLIAALAASLLGCGGDGNPPVLEIVKSSSSSSSGAGAKAPAPPPAASSSSSGSSSSSSSSSGGGASVVSPTALAGIWSAMPRGTLSAQMVSDSTGSFYFRVVTADGCEDLWSGRMQLASDETVNGSSYFWPSVNCADGTGLGGLIGALVPGQSLAFTVPQGTFDWAFNAPVSAETLSLSAIESTGWLTTDDYTLTIDADGVLSASLASWGCNLTGRVRAPDSDSYPVSLTLTGCDDEVPEDLNRFIRVTQGLSTATISGVLTIDSTSSPAVLQLWFTVQYNGGPEDTALAFIRATSQ